MQKARGESSHHQAFLSRFLLCLQGRGLAQQGPGEPSSIGKIFLTIFLSKASSLVRRPLISPFMLLNGGIDFWKTSGPGTMRQDVPTLLSRAAQLVLSPLTPTQREVSLSPRCRTEPHAGQEGGSALLATSKAKLQVGLSGLFLLYSFFVL